MMVIVDAGISHKNGVYLQDKSDATMIVSFDTFCTTVETAYRKENTSTSH